MTFGDIFSIILIGTFNSQFNKLWEDLLKLWRKENIMKTYKQSKDARQAEFSALPIFFAFGKDQFKQAMEERGLTENDVDKIYSIGAGGYFLKSDKAIIDEYFNKPDTLSAHMKDYNFAVEAIYYEMCNHEYGINWQKYWDVCNCFSETELPYLDDNESHPELTYWDLMGWEEQTRRAYRDAERRYYKDAEANEWF